MGNHHAEEDLEAYERERQADLRKREHQQAEYAAIEHMTRSLYASMPGAEQPPSDERGKLWGEVEHNQHYEFCAVIATLIVKNSAIVRK